MFRYVGFHWHPAVPTEVAAAQRMEESIRRAEGWRAALSMPGLRVYAIGDRPGVNGIHPMPLGQGVVLGRLFRRDGGLSDSRDIPLSPVEWNRILDSDGRSLIDGYWGRYIAIFRTSRRGTSVIRDPSGTLPCYRSDVDGMTVLFSWLEDLLAFMPASPIPRVNWAAIAASIAIGQLGGVDTALGGIAQVLPGHLATLDDRKPSSVSMWSAVGFASRRAKHEPDVAAARLRQVVMDCAHAWSSCYEAIVLRLSGGVDSAILLSSLSTSPVTARTTCLNYHSPGADSDERSFARLAATKAGVRLIERERDLEFRLEDILTVSRTPAPEGYTGRMGTGRIDAEVAATLGAQAMFTGVGGDQVFFQFPCTWPAADYLHAHGIGIGFLDASLDAARLGRVSLLQAVRRALADSRLRPGPLDGAWQSASLACREAIDAARHLDRYVHPELLEADLPVGKFRQVQELINPVGYYDPYLGDAAPEIVSPLLSQPVVEFCLTLPTWLLTRGGRGRALARQAFSRDIPRAIATRQSKGGMEEHVAAILRRDLPFARSLLLDGHLVRQGLLDRPKLEAALTGQLSALGEHLSEIHHYLALEAWVRRIEESPRRMAA